MTRNGDAPQTRPPIAPAPAPSARLATPSASQLGPVRAALPNGRELLATHGVAPVGDGESALAPVPEGVPPVAVEPGVEPEPGLVTVWDLKHRRVLRTIRTVPSELLAMATGADGRAAVAALGVDGVLRMWDAMSGHRHWKRPGVRRGGLAVAPLADGRLVVAAGVDYAVRVRDGRTGDKLFDLPTPGQRVPAVAAARLVDGRTLVAGATGGRVTVWDAGSRRRVSHLPGRRLPVAALALLGLPDGTAVLAAATAQTVTIWDAVEGAARFTATFRVEPPRSASGRASLALTRGGDGRVLVAHGPVDSPDVWLWDAETGTAQAGVPGGRTHTWGLTFTDPHAVPRDPDGCASVAVSTGNSTRLWRLDAAPSEVDSAVGTALAAQPASVDAVPGRVTALGYVSGPSGRTLLASAHAGGVLCLREPASGRVVRELQTGGDVETLGVGWERGAPVLVAAGGRSVTRWDPASGRELAHHRWTAPPRLSGLAVAGDEHGEVLVFARALDRLAQWDARTDRPVREWRGRARVPACLAAARPAGGPAVVASGSYDGAVQLWDLAGGTVTRTLVPHLGPVRAVALVPLPDGRLLVLSGDASGVLRIWDADSGALLGVRPDVGGPVTALAGHAQADGTLHVAAAVGGTEPTLRRWTVHATAGAERLDDPARGATAT